MSKKLTTAFNLFSVGAMLCGTLFVGTTVADVAYLNKGETTNQSFHESQLAKIFDIHQMSRNVTGPATAVFAGLSLAAFALKRKFKH